jgi:hypothetical protein
MPYAKGRVGKAESGVGGGAPPPKKKKSLSLVSHGEAENPILARAAPCGELISARNMDPETSRHLFWFFSIASLD